MITAHFREIVNFVGTEHTASVTGPFVAEQLGRHGPTEVHFAFMWMLNWLLRSRVLGYRGAEALPPAAPFSRALHEIVSSSDQLSALFATSPTSLDYRAELGPEARHELEASVTGDFGRHMTD